MLRPFKLNTDDTSRMREYTFFFEPFNRYSERFLHKYLDHDWYFDDAMLP